MDEEGEFLEPLPGTSNNLFDETGGDKIHPGLQITKGQLLSLTLAYYLRHNITKKVSHDMLCLLNDVVPGCVPASKYFVESYFFNDNSKTEMHYYCLKCESYLGTNEDSPFQYLICNDATQITASTCQKADHYFLVHPLKEKLAYLLEKKI